MRFPAGVLILFGTIPAKEKGAPAMKATANAARTAFPDRTQYESTEDIPPRLHAQRAGLSTSEARQCPNLYPNQYGPNALAEEKVTPLGKLFGYFRGFTPVPVEVPAGEARRGER